MSSKSHYQLKMKIHSFVPFLSQALEYLLWASMCMESSVPLLSVRYLTWRATLYTAVCQCYYDCQAGVHGEVTLLVNSEDSDILKYNLSSIFFFRSLASKTQTSKTQIIAMKLRQKSQALPAVICLASLYCWPLGLLSALSLFSIHFSLFCSCSVKISDIFLSWLYSYM